MADLLNLSSYDDTGRYKGKLKLVSHAKIQPVYVICPISSTCKTVTCNPCGLQQATRARDIPLVTLIKGTTIHHNVPVLTGKCPVGVIELNSMSQYSLHSFTYFIHSLLLLPCCVIITIIYPHIRLSIT